MATTSSLSSAGSAVNHDGPSGGLTVPSAQAQRTVVRRCARERRPRSRRGRLHRGPRHRDLAGRPDRAAGARRGLRAESRDRPTARRRLGQDEHRSPRVRRGRRRGHQGGARARARRDPSAPAPQRAEPPDLARRARDDGPHEHDDVARHGRTQGSRDQLVRPERHERAHRAGASAGRGRRGHATRSGARPEPPRPVRELRRGHEGPGLAATRRHCAGSTTTRWPTPSGWPPTVVRTGTTVSLS